MSTTVISVEDASQVSEARRKVVALADRIGFDETARGHAAIVATELASNLVKHGSGGSILASLATHGDEEEIELLAVDAGRGLADVEACLRDGFSTAGSAGQGLGAIRRQSRAMDIASWPDKGAVVLSRLSRQPPGMSPARAREPLWAAVSTPKPGEDVCGDAYAVAEGPGGVTRLLVADGLGHGPAAAEASTAAVRVFMAHAAKEADPTALVERLHAGLRSTRGAAIAVAEIDRPGGRVRYCGVGNISGAIVNGASARRLLSHNGTAGVVARRIQTVDYPYAPGDCVIMHSDGVSASWSFDRYPGLASGHPALVAGVLWRDFARERDDATVLVWRDPT